MPRRPLTHWTVLVVSLLLTGAAVIAVASSARATDEERFNNAVLSTQSRIVARLETYIALLRGGTGLFAAKGGSITYDEFLHYTDRLDIQQRYPGIQGIGFTQRLTQESRDSLIAAMQAQGFADFRIWPDVPDSERYAILYLAPLDQRNRAAIGYDMFTEPTRRAAMVRARDSGMPAMSGRVTLVQEIMGRKQAGFLIYLPVYQGDEIPETVAERRASLRGFVYAPFRADDLFAGILGTEERSKVAFRIYDGRQATEENLLHDSRTGGIIPAASTNFAHTSMLEIAGRAWTITFVETPYFTEGSQNIFVPALGIVGLVLCLALFALSRAQVRAEDEVRRSEGRLRAVLESLPVGVFVADRTGQITFKNAASQKIWNDGDLVGIEQHNGHNGSSPEADHRIQSYEWGLSRALRGETVEAEIVDIEAADGVRKTILNAAFPLRSRSGKVEMAVAALVDITEQRRAREAEARAIREQVAREAAEAREEQLRIHTAELERSNRELQDFAYVASHDLQEPLRKISSFADLLRREYGDVLDDEGRHYLDRMQQAAIRMSNLIRDLLTFSRVTTKTQPFEQVDLNEVLVDVLSDLDVRLKETAGRVDAETLPTIEADPVQMRQLFQNLIGNALKFHRPNVPPVVRIRSVQEKSATPFASAEQDFCRLSIQDNGIGFDEKYLDRVFAPFQRLHTGARYEGTGIGLAICRRIVERHGGEITARSTPGEGTTFILTLPVRQDA